MMSDVLFIADQSPISRWASDYVQKKSRTVLAIFWAPGEPLPTAHHEWRGDWIISFKSDLILANADLARAGRGALNFHPAPETYRGIGGYQYAIYNGDRSYGVTCHHMNSRVDAGPIIATRRFPIYDSDTAGSLKERAGSECASLLFEIVERICSGDELTLSPVAWCGPLYKRTQLSAFLSRLAIANPKHPALS